MFIVKIILSLMVFYGFGYLFALCVDKGMDDAGHSSRTFMLWVGHSMVVGITGLALITGIWEGFYFDINISWRTVGVVIAGFVYILGIIFFGLAEQIEERRQD